ncbi:MAG: efflux RND transporter permease subunit [Candidatus Omnitrophica bacterium]|nr:efflux RND transporter permease subunit [Candidatus Omnitrophota bacterium]
MTLSDLSIKNPVFAWMLMFSLILFGAIGFLGMGVSQMPDVDFPIINVSAAWEGAAPEVMETDVVDVLEDAVMNIQGIREVSSNTRQGQANVTVEFELNRDIDAALQEVQTKVAQAQRRLPEDIDPPVVTKSNPQDQPIIWMGVAGEIPLRDLMGYVQDRLKDRFQTIEGVGEVFLGGWVERNLRVWLDAEKLEAFQLTVGDVIAAIEREHAERPAGRIETAEKEFNVRTMGEAASVEEFGGLVIAARGGQPIHKPITLREVAAIEDGLADRRRISRVMGSTAVGLGIRKQRGANEVAVARRVLERLAEVQKELPPGIEMGVNFNRTRFIEDSMRELVFTLFLSAILTSLVCWLFLGSWSATLNILLAIPTSILGTFIVTFFLGFTLNTFTILGLTLAIGIVVDDAIMVLENIVRHQEMGLDRVEAARQGARQITFAALAATLAIVAIFLPVAFMQGLIGRFFFEFGVTISVAVALSLLEALTLAPMRCAQFLQVGQRQTAVEKEAERGFGWLARQYRKVLALALGRRGLVLAAAAAFFAASVLLIAPRLRREFVPPQDQSMFLVRLQTPVGSSLGFTDERFKKAEAFAMSRPEIKRYFGAIGGFGGGEVNTGVLFVTFKPPRERPVVAPNKKPLAQKDLMTLFRKELNKIPDVRASVQDLSLSGFSAQRGFPIELTVRGPQWDKLGAHAEEIRRRMAQSPLLVDVDTDFLEPAVEIQVRPNREAAAQRGVGMEAVARTINAAVGGERVAKYTKGARRYDVRVRLVPSQRSREEDVRKLWVWNNRGERVPLSEVVTVERKATPLTITRRQRERAISLFANVAPGQSQAAALDEAERIAKEVLPEGYRAVFGGSSQTFRESVGSLVFALVLGIVIAYMVLGSQYNSYVHPFTVLLALPFSLSGALIALWIADQSLNIMSYIGLILLMGIVKKNSILLVDFTNQMRRQGKGVSEALLAACPIRLRPILMTSISTVAAALPPAMALGPGAEARIPMAVTVIGGVIVSTVLTLLVVPCAYSALARLEHQKYG